jgi:hypothetical protein
MIYQDGIKHFYQFNIVFAHFHRKIRLFCVGAILLKIIESRQISNQENRGPHGIAVLMPCISITEYSICMIWII